MAFIETVSDESLWKRHGEARGVRVSLEKTPDAGQTMLRLVVSGWVLI